MATMTDPALPHVGGYLRSIHLEIRTSRPRIRVLDAHRRWGRFRTNRIKSWPEPPDAPWGVIRWLQVREGMAEWTPPYPAQAPNWLAAVFERFGPYDEYLRERFL